MAGESIGYSGTPLPKKLGIKAGHRILVVGAPAGFDLGRLPEDVELDRGGGDQRGGKQGTDRYDVVLAFCPDQATLERRFAPLKRRLDPASALWIAWPKKASKVPTDLTEGGVREHGLALGLVDVKICAVDLVWSGLKFVYRTADRPNLSRIQA